MPQNADGVGEVLTALADPTRRMVLETLATQGEATATTLATALPVTRQAVVQHLAVLRDAGLVSSERVGREVRYAVRPGPLEDAGRWMRERASAWDRNLQRLKRAAEADDGAAPPHGGPKHR